MHKRPEKCRIPHRAIRKLNLFDLKVLHEEEEGKRKPITRPCNPQHEVVPLLHHGDIARRHIRSQAYGIQRPSLIDDHILTGAPTEEVHIVAFTPAQFIIPCAAVDEITDIGSVDHVVAPRADDLDPTFEQLLICQRAAVTETERLNCLQTQHIVAVKGIQLDRVTAGPHMDQQVTKIGV